MTDAERDGYVNGFAGWSREGNFIHYCRCGSNANFGVGVALRKGEFGTWYCLEHWSDRSERREAKMAVLRQGSESRGSDRGAGILDQPNNGSDNDGLQGCRREGSTQPRASAAKASRGKQAADRSKGQGQFDF